MSTWKFEETIWMQDITLAVCEVADVEPRALRNAHSGSKSVTLARQIASMIALDHGAPMKDVGLLLQRSPSAIRSGLETLKERLKDEQAVMEIVIQAADKLQALHKLRVETGDNSDVSGRARKGNGQTNFRARRLGGYSSAVKRRGRISEGVGARKVSDE